MTILKAFADDKLNVAKITISLCDRVENTVGKEENAGYQHFLLFPQCFQKPSLGFLKVGIVWQRVKIHQDKCERPLGKDYSKYSTKMKKMLVTSSFHC